jgi:hypothetical protein
VRNTRAGVAAIAAAVLILPTLTAPALAQPSGRPVAPQQATPQTSSQQQGQQGEDQQAGSQNAQQLNPKQQEVLAHLNAAHDALAELAKLPEATKLQGDARTQVNELITNFNTLITSKGPSWREPYDRLQANLSALLGAATSSGPADQGAVGTTGQTGAQAAGEAASGIDPAITSRLVRLRQELTEFGKLMSGEPTAGTSGTTASETTGTSGTTAGASDQEIQAHLDAMESIIQQALSNSPSTSSSSTAATGTSSDTSSSSALAGPVTMDRAQLESLRQHAEQLRQALRQRGPRNH